MSFTQAKLSEWFAEIRLGRLHCPSEGCTWSFFTSFELADHIHGDCEFGTYKGDVPCTHCPITLKVDGLKTHWRKSHKDIVAVLSVLHKGSALQCPNYLCKEEFNGSFDGCKLYLKHSIGCPPLYLCEGCKREYASRNIFNQHKCKGDIRNISVSKKEVAVSRNIEERPQLNVKEEQVLIQQWKEDFTNGKFKCPVPSCTQSFFIPNHFVSHLQKESNLDNIFNNIHMVKCPYCSTALAWQTFGRHMQNNHREIVNYVNFLKSGEKISCPNYKCSSDETYMAETGAEYMQHAVQCHPLYCCEKCGMESKSSKYMRTHLPKCGKNNPKMQGFVKKEFASPEVMQKLLSPSPEKQFKLSQSQEKQGTATSDFRRKRKTDLDSSYVKNDRVGYGIDKKQRTHLKRKKSKFRSKSNTSESSDGGNQFLSKKIKQEFLSPFSLTKTKMTNNFKQSRSKKYTSPKGTKSNPTSPKVKKIGVGVQKRIIAKASNKVKSVDTDGNLADSEPTPVDFSSDVSEVDGLTGPDGLYTPIVIPSDQVRSSFPELLPQNDVQMTRGLMHKEVKRKVQETMQSNTLLLKNRRKSTPVKSTQSIEDIKSVHQTPDMYSSNDVKNLVDKWLSDIKVGIWNCVYPMCEKTFHLPDQFHSHIMSYSSNDQIRKKIFLSKLSCCFCETFFGIPGFVRHFRQNHSEILLSLNGRDSLSCPLHECGESFTSGEEYLKHRCSCLVEQREREDEKEEERRKGLQTKWQLNLKEGVLCCANDSCKKTFSSLCDLVIHMKKCATNEMNKYISNSDGILCPWDDELIKLHHFNDHVNVKHPQIVEVLNANEEGYTCPNFNCNTILSTVQEFIRHTVNCPTCLVCYDCNQTFIHYAKYKEHNCLANDQFFLKKSIHLWYNQVRSGQIRCPNSSCDAWFFIVEKFVEHVEKCSTKSVFCSQLLKNDDIPCSFCNLSMTWSEYLTHMKTNHGEIQEQLQKLQNKEELNCLNYKCKKTFSDGFKYFHHASICKPLYLCESCQTEYKTFQEYTSHSCKVLNETDKNEEEQNTVDAHHEIEKDIWMWCNDLKNALYKCPSAKCKQVFNTFETLIPHLKACKKYDDRCKAVIDNDQFGCCLCKLDVPLSRFAIHFKTMHKKVWICLDSLAASRHSIRCPSVHCRKVFLNSGKFLKHVIECFKKRKNNEMDKWHNDIIKGNLVCPNELCGKKNTFIENFIEHLKMCKVGRNSSKAMGLPIPCLICKDSFPAKCLAEHFRTQHTVVFAQLRLVEQGICIHCPNIKCKQAFAYGTAYLQHVATKCKPTNSCEKCNTTFESFTLLASHKCSSMTKSNRPEDKIWDKISHAPWYERVMKGDLTCPNSECVNEFILPRDFIQHLRLCTEGSECTLILKRNELPCCFCKSYVTLAKYCSHLSSCHKQSAKKQSQPLPEDTIKMPSIVLPQNYPGFKPPLRSPENDPGSPSKRGRNRKAKPRKISANREVSCEDESHSTIEEAQVEEQNSEDSPTDIEPCDFTVTEQSEFVTTDQEKTDVSESEVQPQSSISESEDIETTNKREHCFTNEDPYIMDVMDDLCKSQVPDTESPTLLKSNLIVKKDIPVDEKFGTSSSFISTTSPDAYEKLRNKLNKRPKYKKRLTEDKEVINLVQELLRKKRKRSRFGHRTSMCAQVGEWTITSKPKRIKTEDCSSDQKDLHTESIQPSQIVTPSLMAAPIDTISQSIHQHVTLTNSLAIGDSEFVDQSIDGNMAEKQFLEQQILLDLTSKNSTSQSIEQVNAKVSDAMSAKPSMEDRKTEQLTENSPKKCKQPLQVLSHQISHSIPEQLDVTKSDKMHEVAAEDEKVMEQLTEAVPVACEQASKVSVGSHSMSASNTFYHNEGVHMNPSKLSGNSVKEIGKKKYQVSPSDPSKFKEGKFVSPIIKISKVSPVRSPQKEFTQSNNFDKELLLAEKEVGKLVCNEESLEEDEKSVFKRNSNTKQGNELSDTQKIDIDLPKKNCEMSSPTKSQSGEVTVHQSPTMEYEQDQKESTQSAENQEHVEASIKVTDKSEADELNSLKKDQTVSEPTKGSCASTPDDVVNLKGKYKSVRKCLTISMEDAVQGKQAASINKTILKKVTRSRTNSLTESDQIKTTRDEPVAVASESNLQSETRSRMKRVTGPDLVKTPNSEKTAATKDTNLRVGLKSRRKFLTETDQTKSSHVEETKDLNLRKSRRLRTKSLTETDQMKTSHRGDSTPTTNENLRIIKETRIKSLTKIDQIEIGLSEQTKELNVRNPSKSRTKSLSESDQIETPQIEKSTPIEKMNGEKNSSSETKSFTDKMNKKSAKNKKSDESKDEYFNEKYGTVTIIADNTDNKLLEKSLLENTKSKGDDDYVGYNVNKKPLKYIEPDLLAVLKTQNDTLSGMEKSDRNFSNKIIQKSTTSEAIPIVALELSKNNTDLTIMGKTENIFDQEQVTKNKVELKGNDNLGKRSLFEVEDTYDGDDVDGLDNGPDEQELDFSESTYDQQEGTPLDVSCKTEPVQHSKIAINVTSRCEETSKEVIISDTDTEFFQGKNIPERSKSKDRSDKSQQSVTLVDEKLDKIPSDIKMKVNEELNKTIEKINLTEKNLSPKKLCLKEPTDTNKNIPLNRRFKYSKIKPIRKAIPKVRPNITAEKVQSTMQNKTKSQNNMKSELVVDEKQKADLITLMSITNDAIMKSNLSDSKNNNVSPTVLSFPDDAIKNNDLQPSSVMSLATPDSNRSILYQSFPSIDVPVFESDDHDKADSCFIDFKIEESISDLSVKIELPSSPLTKTESMITSYESTDVSDTETDVKKKKKFRKQSDNMAIKTTTHDIMEPSSPDFPSMTQPIIAMPPLKEMYFLLPKKNTDERVLESHDECDNACELPNLPLLDDKKLKIMHRKTKLSEQSDILQLQESQVIENALQDLLSTVPKEDEKLPKNNKLLQKWKEDLCAYKFYCAFDGCAKTFKSLSALMQHMYRCKKEENAWEEIADEKVICPECKKSILIRKYARHFRTAHIVISDTLNMFENESNVRCSHYNCNVLMLTVDACLHHSRTCGYLQKCLKCFKECVSKKVFKYHDCKPTVKEKETSLDDQQSCTDLSTSQSIVEGGYIPRPDLPPKEIENVFLSQVGTSTKTNNSSTKDGKPIIHTISPDDDLPLELDLHLSTSDSSKIGVTLNILDPVSENAELGVSDDTNENHCDRNMPMANVLCTSVNDGEKVPLDSTFKLLNKINKCSVNIVKSDPNSLLWKARTKDMLFVPSSEAEFKKADLSVRERSKLKRPDQIKPQLFESKMKADVTVARKKPVEVCIVNATITGEKRMIDTKHIATKIWIDRISTYQFSCPSKECKDISFLRISTMLSHIKICVKKDTKKLQEFLNADIKCPECEKKFVVAKLAIHFDTEHLLLNWYFEQTELGNWAICQNHTCGKYMEKMSDMVKHYRVCKYLWKCKYCSIEYEDEPSVSKHHCQTSSSEDEIHDDEAKDEEKGGKRRRNNPSINTRSAKPKNRSGKTGNSKDKNASNSSEHSYDKSLSYCVNLTEWLTTFLDFSAKCPVMTCQYKNVYPIKLLSHVRTCAETPHTEVNEKIMNDINKLKMKCQVEGCKRDKDVFNTKDYITHLKGYHLLLLQNLSKLQTHGMVNCLNYTCNEELWKADDVKKHFEKCKYLWRCDNCRAVYKTFKTMQSHDCQKSEEKYFEDQKDDTLPILEDGKRRKRKSAARACEILSGLHKDMENKKAKTDDSPDTEVLSESEDEDYIAPNESSQSESEDATSDEEVTVDDEEEFGSEEDRPFNVANAYNFYDARFFKEWLKEHKNDEFLFSTLMPNKADITILNDEYQDFIPFASSSPSIEIDYHTQYKKGCLLPSAIKLFDAIPALPGSCGLGFNAGGPVWALEWCPIQSGDSQYLAVATHRSYSEFHSVVDAAPENGLIQLWEMGSLKNDKILPTLRLAICHNVGPVYDLKWCPSSCYGNKSDSKDGKELKRLGLLAAACADGKVRIYSIPDPEALAAEKRLFVKMRPALLLIPHKFASFERNRTGMCLCLSWSLSHGHKMIAGGYGDGSVRIWNICTQSLFLKVKELGREVILPPIIINAHSYAVRSLKWCPYNKDVIASASADKALKIFNINEPHIPIFNVKRGKLVDIQWPIPRLGLFLCEDDCFNYIPGSARYLLLEQVFGVLSKERDRPHATTRHNATVFSCSYNNYLDFIATCDVAGEVLVCTNLDSVTTKVVPLRRKTQPVYRIERTLIDKKSQVECQSHDKDIDLDCVDLIEEYTKSNDDDLKAFNKYTYKFCDSNKFEFTKYRRKDDPEVKRSLRMERLQECEFIQGETRSVQKVTWNQNFGCHTWLASGTRIGIVRVHNFKAWRNKPL